MTQSHTPFSLSSPKMSFPSVMYRRTRSTSLLSAKKSALPVERAAELCLTAPSRA